MRERPSEVVAPHSRLLRLTLEADNAREYWRRPQAHVGSPERVAEAFNDYWFGARSMERVRDLLANFDLRFAAYPAALETLHAWSEADRDTRVAICHWHVQLADPIYRAFTGELLPARREGGRPLTRDAVLRWVRDRDPGERWGPATHAQFASKLLSCAHAAGLVGSTRDPRPLLTPRVTTSALGYLLHLLRHLEFAGSLHDNPYLRSVGIVGMLLDDRIRAVPGITLSRVANVVEFAFDHAAPLAWVRATQMDHAA